MTENMLLTTCPVCQASFHVAAEQLEQAGGKVRCGNCLKVFDGISGEVEFIPPTLPDVESSHPVSGIDVKPMSQADLPSRPPAKPWSAITILAGLLAMLAAQLYLPATRDAATRLPVELSRVVVRPHPEAAGALRLDAVLRNRSDQPAAYPLLVLGFTNRQGEPRARRAFLPAEYLHGNPALRLPPRSEIQISLAFVDPGRDAVNYVAGLESPASFNSRLKPPAEIAN
jgi:predicted Zn finger-like uncharacterized protein